ncbi:hypothetical protein SAMN05421837_11474 [Amycolatopsis pretoriensis]|uniref:Rv3651-like N-terminal domain-containing protein n=1 Tax=Amycolatopsis pretoriensis TaxID=218821 RepID=A0A1H5RHH0_9PSEU|nr:hypothetical protein [Amycolatopsis pretoriensis]SEF37514.1 hypothetical protein SAMN05421837_11474 [Amycolatopsis pretoriensis]
MTTRNPKSRRHEGQWLVFDEESLLYAIGDVLYTGVSLNNADLAVRKIVAPMMERARKTGVEQRETMHFGYDAFDVGVKPALGGRDGSLVALQACYVPTGERFPARPPIAVWEWDEPAPGGGALLRHWWGEEAPRFYGVEPPSADWHGGASGRDPYRFMDSVLTDEFRVAIAALMQDFRDAEIDEPVIMFMAQRHVAMGSLRGVRAVGRRKSGSYYAGFSANVGLSEVHRAVSGPLMRQLGAFAAIVTDPLMVVDVVHEAVVVTSDDFAHIDVPVPANSSLRAMVHVDDVDDVLELVRYCAKHPGERSRPVRGSLRTRAGAWLDVFVHAVGTSNTARSVTKFVMCRLEVT